MPAPAATFVLTDDCTPQLGSSSAQMLVPERGTFMARTVSNEAPLQVLARNEPPAKLGQVTHQ